MKPRKPLPPHRCPVLPVRRDVCPGYVPVLIQDDDGQVIVRRDMAAEVVDGLEAIAKRKGVTFASLLEGG